MSNEDKIRALATAVVAELGGAGQRLATAESCTGGWIAKSLTDIPGSSACFGLGVVSYSNDAKASVLGVADSTLETFGAVSETTVREMAEGVLALSGADIAVAVSGIAGPEGGTEEKPVGTVWFAWSAKRGSGITTDAACHRLDGSRDQVRARSVVIALGGVRDRIEQAVEH
jgi:nicotinamide-nucleotide amidase